MKILSLLAVVLVFLAACTTAPITGRSQLILIPESTEISQGQQAYKAILRQSVISRNAEAQRLVRKVGEKIARVANKPNYRWEFTVIDDPEMANAFAVPGGKVAVYTGIFPAARDEAGLAVILGHEVAHALARHGAERMSRDQIVQLGGLGLAAGLGGNPQALQAYGLGTSIGLVLPFSRSQELEADRIGLRLMAEAGYDPSASLDLWKRMAQSEAAKGRGAPPSFLSTHPGYEQRTQQLRAWIPEAMRYYRPTTQTVEKLPSLQALDSSKGRAERELIKRIQEVDRLVRDARGERALFETLGNYLQVDPNLLYQERQRLRMGYGEYTALRSLAFKGKTSFRGLVASYTHGTSWSNLARRYSVPMADLTSFIRQIGQTTARVQGRRR
ncbi:MAG: M48 family metalloprotease [Deltaproteobacteria bacterium]|nr:M48 family metalloprotease [Deltaproteobacteria bacterium]